LITFTHKGDLGKATRYFQKLKEFKIQRLLEKYGKKGVDALAAMTPVDSGRTAASWSYEIEQSDQGAVIYFNNSNINKNVNIALILQYGHGTRNGGYVQGRDYINPAIQPVFEALADEAWGEVTSL